MPGRTWNDNKSVSTTSRETNFLTGQQTEWHNIVPIYQHEGSKEWLRTQDWRQVRKNWRDGTGVLPMNRFSYTNVHEELSGTRSHTIKWIRPEDGVTIRDDRYDDDFYGTNTRSGGGLAPSARDQAVADGVARNKVLVSMKDQKTNVVQMAAERKQTGVLFETTVKRVVGTVVLLRQGNWNGAARNVGMPTSARKHRKHLKRHAKDAEKATASAWLELQYGWIPLLSDVYGSAELIAQKAARERKERVTKSHSVMLRKAEQYPDPSGSGLYSITLTQRTEYTVKYTVYYATPSDELHTLSQVGITNPALIAWELMPWSFVVDWFLPIGNFISTFDATLGLEFQCGCKTTVDDRYVLTTHVGHDVISPNGASVQRYTDSSKSVWRKVSLLREPLLGFPSSRFPSFKNPVSPVHMANLVALLSTTFRRR